MVSANFYLLVTTFKTANTFMYNKFRFFFIVIKTIYLFCSRKLFPSLNLILKYIGPNICITNNSRFKNMK